MNVFAIASATLAIFALVMREIYLAKERAIILASIEALRVGFENARTSIRRSHEELFLVQALLIERGLILEQDIQSARNRLIETPRRRAEERESVTRHLGHAPDLLVLDDTEGKVH